MLEVQKYLLQNNGDFNKLSDEFGIIVNNHPTDKRTILNYCQIDSYKHRFNPIVRECRGLVLNRECFSVIAKGFNRFFNIGENPNDSVFNWNKFETYEKADGSLILLYNWGGKWYVNTRNSFADKYFCDGFNKTWSEFVFDILKRENVNLNDLNYNICYVLELCSRYNKVVRDYETPQLFHLASFGLLDCQEKDCKIPNIKSPVKYEFDSQESLQKFLKEQENLDPTFEGFVLNDGNTRIKAKNKTYLNFHALKNNSNLFAIKNLVPFLLKGEAEELCVYFSERKDYIKNIDKQIKDHLDLLYWLWEDASKCSSKKEIVKRGLTDTPLRGMLFVAFDRGVHPKTLVSEFEDCIIKLIKQGK